jgi:class 3 adenylate cyclase/tetratricopeptide (TPR) repeat protein
VAVRGTQTVAADGELVGPYLPRIAVDWLLHHGEARHRAVDGTMAFVDISGFTAMSELLAPKGRLGAEEVTDVMNATFSRLLGVAYENGGGLVKLGGDAMLLFFDGADHSRRACSASWGMRDSLRALGAVATSGGPVSLRMHVGIHSGAFDFFLVGNRHRELIVAGPDAAATVLMEEAAEAGEIVVSAATASWLGRRELGAAKGAGVLLAAPPAVALTGIPPVPDPAGLDLLGCVPEALRDHLLARTIESEHRHAAVAFVRFSGVTELLAREGLDAVCDAVDEVVTTLQEAAAQHDVCFLESDIDALGGRVVVVAGAPVTSGDDEERLLRTVRAAVDAETRLPLHVGVASGNVFAGQVGPSFRHAYTILGGTAALAARLMAKASPRSIWTTPDVVARSATEFTVSPVGALSLKGKARPVEAVAIAGIERKVVAERRKLPLVDRQRELPMLDAVLVPVKMGFGNFVELVGDPGVGKSRIVEELCSRAADFGLVSTACDQYEATTPYFPFRKLLRDVLDVSLGDDAAANSEALTQRVAAVDPELAPWMPLVADVLDAPVVPTRASQELQPSFRRARLHGVVEAILESAFASPTLLLFEDVHWMDEASSDLLRHLGSRITTKPWLVCATRRTNGGGFVAAEGTPPVAALSLRLEPLPEADAVELATAAADGDLSAAELAAITERAAGNPLFVQELVAARGGPGRSGGDELPESVEGVVTTRIDSLAPADRALLRWASVLGATFTGDLVSQVLEGDPDAALDSESWDRLAAFVERDPYVAGTFRFRHALIRDAAYNGLSFRRRRELHARVADVLLQSSRDEDVAEMLSLHYSLAGRADEAWRFSLTAARRARAKFANLDAAEFYRRALDAAGMLPTLPRGDVGRTWEELADVLERSGEYDDAHRAYREARRLLRGDDAAIAALCLKEGRLAEYQGDYTRALRWFGRGLRVADALDGPAARTERLRLSLGYAVTRFRQGAVRDCIARCVDVAATARATGDLAELAHAYYLLHLSYASIGSPARVEVRDLALPIYEELGDLLGQANALNHLGIDAYYEGRWEAALSHYERSLEARQRIGDVVGAATMMNNIAEIYSDQGHTDDAERLFLEARATFDNAGSSAYLAVVTANLGRAAARAGRLEEARELYDQALKLLQDVSASSFVAETFVRIAELDVIANRPEAALDSADFAEELVESTTPSVRALLHRVRACAHAQLGDVAAADSELDRSLAVARGAGAVYETALSLRLSARIHDDDAVGATAQALLDELHVTTVVDPPLRN